VDIGSVLWGYSKALYSTWLFYRPDHLLLDCGEGTATALGNGSYGIERVLLTHGHIDHLAGLPPLLWTRAGGMGHSDKPLQIFHPANEPSVALMKDYLFASRRKWPFDLEWIPLQDGDSIPLSPGEKPGLHTRRVQCFATRHIRNQLTLGYKVLETRRRLKPEFAHLPPGEIGKMARDIGGENLSEFYEAPIFVCSGDSAPIDVEHARGAEVLAHEATIVHSEDKKGEEHSTLDEALDLAQRARPRALVLYHFSWPLPRRAKSARCAPRRAAAASWIFRCGAWSATASRRHGRRWKHRRRKYLRPACKTQNKQTSSRSTCPGATRARGAKMNRFADPVRLAVCTAALCASACLPAVAHAQQDDRDQNGGILPLPDGVRRVIAIDAQNTLLAELEPDTPGGPSEYRFVPVRHVYAGGVARLFGGDVISTEEFVSPAFSKNNGQNGRGRLNNTPNDARFGVQRGFGQNNFNQNNGFPGYGYNGYNNGVTVLGPDGRPLPTLGPSIQAPSSLRNPRGNTFNPNTLFPNGFVPNGFNPNGVTEQNQGDANISVFLHGRLLARRALASGN
jgi:ribonuclease Z